MGTKLKSILLECQIEKVFICGLTTPHCVSTTTRMSGNLGFDTYLVEDATVSFAIMDYQGFHLFAKWPYLKR
ncbi:isochorismatase family protein [Bombilactobacillus thymidiniphilus]|uniref:isochorismatase family protein n=1 Tax=Bombilactobacillus thymidiniphilus TaxID=2923363 RepID=UPI0021ADB821|nr:isochorismatase family protein [Bombilactobacillus thymidiniphilus]